ncbi:hypothetical protein ACFQS2_06055 [Brachybacterium sp. GCM10030267]|uniref:hypothetical protein n=1 Tax=unclassified Brachybacterium TaxID=2623841 RepID=UPI0036207A86
MKVTDTHPSAAEHFDYLEPDLQPETAADEAQIFARERDETLTGLVEATGPLAVSSRHLSARSA